MVRYATRGLKIGVQSWFDPKFDVGIRTFFPENFGQAYCPPEISKITVRRKSSPFKATKILNTVYCVSKHPENYWLLYFKPINIGILQHPQKETPISSDQFQA